MSIKDIIEGLQLLQVLEIARPLLVIFVIWTIGFIKIDGERLWAKLLKKVGEDINWKVLKEVDKIDKTLDSHIEESELKEMREIRSKIIRFADEIYQGRSHTKEHFEEMLKMTNTYEDYSTTHPNFPNNQAVLSIQKIKEDYKDGKFVIETVKAAEK